MSKFSAALVAFVLAAVLSASGAALARGGGGGHGGGGHGGGHFGGGHFGGGHFGGGHFGGGHMHIGGGHIGHVHVGGGPRFAHVAHGGALSAHAMRGPALGHVFAAHGAASALRSPFVRAGVAAAFATGAFGPRAHGLWWQHANGGYGWVGPLYWPFAYDDIYDYALWGPPYGGPFWTYGYNDIYAGIFAPYGYDTLTGYFPRYASLYPAPRQGRARTAELADPLAQMCSADAGDIAGVPVVQIQQLLDLNPDQRAALSALSAASTKASGDVRAACPSDMALTAPARLAVMEQRIDAMISAVQGVQMPLQKFYDSLNDEQRQRFTALVEQQRQNLHRLRTPPAPLATADCGVARPGVMDWPEAQIEQRLHPTDAQREPLAALRDAATKAADMLKSCEPNNATTLPARLAAMNDRLNTMLDAVKIVRVALDKFYASLTDEQKAQFEAIGRERMG
jgi:hypothetical protein